MKRDVVTAMLSVMLATTAHADTFVSMQRDLQAVQKFYEIISDGTNPALPDSAKQVIASNWKAIPASIGGNNLEGFVKTFQIYGQVIPDMTFKPQEILRDGNRYIVRSTITGTPVAPFLVGTLPNGKSFKITATDIHTVVNGKIVTSYHVEDWEDAAQQLQ